MVWGCLVVVLVLVLIALFSVKGKGEYGEDRIYDILQKVDGYKATLPNCYLPKGNGETAEVDLIFLHESGIYVFESKNYSGWIFDTPTCVNFEGLKKMKNSWSRQYKY